MKSDLRKPMLVSHRIIDNARQDALNPETKLACANLLKDETSTTSQSVRCEVVAKQVSVLRTLKRIGALYIQRWKEWDSDKKATSCKAGQCA